MDSKNKSSEAEQYQLDLIPEDIFDFKTIDVVFDACIKRLPHLADAAGVDAFLPSEGFPHKNRPHLPMANWRYMGYSKGKQVRLGLSFSRRLKLRAS